MEPVELTRSVLETLDSCPKCQFKLTQKSDHYLKCDQCGLTLELTTGKERFLNLLIAGVILAGIVAFIVGIEISKLIAHV